MGSHNLPLLHKYVLSPGEDMQLQLTKLRYRLCVKEVGEVLAAKHLDFCSPAVMDGSVVADCYVSGELNTLNKDIDAPLDASSPVDTKAPSIDDSGIVCDESRLSGSPDMELGDLDNSMQNGHTLDTEDITTPDQECSMDTAVADKDYCSEEEAYSENVVENGVEHEMENGVEEELITVTEYVRPESGYRLEASAELSAGSVVVDPTSDEDSSRVQAAPEIVVSEPTEPAREGEDEDEDLQITITEETTGDDLPERTPVVEEEVVEDLIEKTEVERKKKSVSIDVGLDQEPEPEPEPEPEVPRVEFRRGMNKVDNVEDALDILKTRYRLSGIPVRKVILTWSSWNIKDLIHQPMDSDDDSDDDDENSPVWADKKDDDILDKEEVVDLLGTILDKEKELEELLESVLEEERKRKAEEDAKNKADAPVEEEMMKADAGPQAQAAPPTGTEPDEVTECKDEPEKEGDKPDEEGTKKKKKGNLLSRMVRALRKRLGRRERA